MSQGVQSGRSDLGSEEAAENEFLLHLESIGGGGASNINYANLVSCGYSLLMRKYRIYRRKICVGELIFFEDETCLIAKELSKFLCCKDRCKSYVNPM